MLRPSTTTPEHAPTPPVVGQDDRLHLLDAGVAPEPLVQVEVEVGADADDQQW